LNEIKNSFRSIDEDYIVDCTVGYGGHSEELLEQNENIKIICCDRDKNAIEFSQKRLERFKDRVIFENSPFSKVILKYKKFPIRGILADIGVSSLQLDKRERGFGFDSPVLDMRMDENSGLSAFEVVNSYSQSELERIFRDYGEIREYKRAAKMIIDARTIMSAFDLSRLFEKFSSKKRINPATLIFQAIRIEVNNELGELKELLDSIRKIEPKNCKVGIISFHSLEDRIVKRAYKEWAKSCICPS
jgi:16S rRNA (cytosine1402-N4)-methyltransferase